MADNWSDTETDDELLERVHASQTRSVRAHVKEDASHARSADSEPVEPTQQASERGSVSARAMPMGNDQRDSSTAAESAALGTMRQVSPPRKKAGFLALILNDDDADNPPRVDPAHRQQAGPSPSPSRTTRWGPRPAAPFKDVTNRPYASMPARSTVDVSMEKSDPAPPPVPRDLPYEVHHQQAVAPLVQMDQAVAPSDDQFVSPFASLAAPYRPPPPPVYGAPPVSYVPGRMAADPFAPSADLPVPVSQVPCFRCSRMLPLYGSTVPRAGYSACSCCQLYYSQIAIRPGVSKGRLCAMCVGPPMPAPPPPPPAPPPASASASSSIFPSPPASSQAFPRGPVHPPGVTPASLPPATTPSVPPAPLLPGASFECGLCKESVRFVPPVGNDRLQCNCCMVIMSAHAFSKNQRRSSHPCRRCAGCLKTRATPAKFKGIHNSKPAVVDPHQPNRHGAQGNTSHNVSQRPTRGSPATRVECTPEQRRQMEIDVRNYKLAKRSIHRRRMANDLRGSTRVEYDMQLHDEEQKVEAKMVRAWSANPALFDEVAHDTKVKSVSVAPWERDNPRPTKKTAKTITPTKQSEKAKAKPSTPTSAKRKLTGGESETPPPVAKRSRVSPAKASPTIAAATKTEEKTMPSSVSLQGDSSDSSPPRSITTRARTRQAPKPIVVIDLLDSDSD